MMTPVRGRMPSVSGRQTMKVPGNRGPSSSMCRRSASKPSIRRWVVKASTSAVRVDNVGMGGGLEEGLVHEHVADPPPTLRAGQQVADMAGERRPHPLPLDHEAVLLEVAPEGQAVLVEVERLRDDEGVALATQGVLNDGLGQDIDELTYHTPRDGLEAAAAVEQLTGDN